MSKFGTRNALFGYFWPKMPYLDIFGLESKKKRLSYSKSAPLNLSNCKILWKMKMPKFETKSALFGYFWARILKNYRHIWNQHLWISVTASFCEETTMPKFGTKNTLFGYFWARIFKKLLSYLKSAPLNLCICKISKKNKNV